MIVIFLTVLKVIGIVLLVLLCLMAAAVLLVLFVPVRCRAAAGVTDPDRHDEFPREILRDQFRLEAEAVWLFRLLAVQIRYPHPGAEALTVRIFGRKIDVHKFLHGRGAQNEHQEENRQRKSAADKLKDIPERLETICNRADFYWRIATGSCGRKAFSKIVERFSFLLKGTGPVKWSAGGTAGLGDPYHSGKISEILAILSPFAGEHLDIMVEWNAYRIDLRGNIEGKIRMIRVIRAVLPIVFDRDCRKLLRKFKAAGKRDFTPRGMHERAVNREQKSLLYSNQ